ncbi:hypothetical protein DVH05_001172 [Phytophthora capsici]|nr:hypothetical protein DVH05_001172 [Phytophthora capsici]
MDTDSSFGSSLQFGFEGQVPAVNYPLEKMAKLAILDVPLGDSALNEQVVASSIASSLSSPPFRFTRHGKYPKRHAILLIAHDNIPVQLVFLVERKLENNAVEWAKQLANDVNYRSVEELAQFSTQHLESYLKRREELLRSRMENSPQLNSVTSSGIQWFLIVYESSRFLYDTVVKISPEHPSGIPPLKLHDDPHALFLREKAIDADDISMGDARIFLEVNKLLKKKGRIHRQSAEQIVVDGQLLWIIATSYGTLETFTIADAEVPLELLDEVFDRLCAFGAAGKSLDKCRTALYESNNPSQ